MPFSPNALPLRSNALSLAVASALLRITSACSASVSGLPAMMSDMTACVSVAELLVIALAATSAAAGMKLLLLNLICACMHAGVMSAGQEEHDQKKLRVINEHAAGSCKLDNFLDRGDPCKHDDGDSWRISLGNNDVSGICLTAAAMSLHQQACMQHAIRHVCCYKP